MFINKEGGMKKFTGSEVLLIASMIFLMFFSAHVLTGNVARGVAPEPSGTGDTGGGAGVVSLGGGTMDGAGITGPIGGSTGEPSGATYDLLGGAGVTSLANVEDEVETNQTSSLINTQQNNTNNKSVECKRASYKCGEWGKCINGIQQRTCKEMLCGLEPQIQKIECEETPVENNVNSKSGVGTSSNSADASDTSAPVSVGIKSSSSAPSNSPAPQSTSSTSGTGGAIILGGVLAIGTTTFFIVRKYMKKPKQNAVQTVATAPAQMVPAYPEQFDGRKLYGEAAFENLKKYILDAKNGGYPEPTIRGMLGGWDVRAIDGAFREINQSK